MQLVYNENQQALTVGTASFPKRLDVDVNKDVLLVVTVGQNKEASDEAYAQAAPSSGAAPGSGPVTTGGYLRVKADVVDDSVEVSELDAGVKPVIATQDVSIWQFRLSPTEVTESVIMLRFAVMNGDSTTVVLDEDIPVPVPLTVHGTFTHSISKAAQWLTSFSGLLTAFGVIVATTLAVSRKARTYLKRSGKKIEVYVRARKVQRARRLAEATAKSEDGG